MQQAGEGKEAGALTGASAPEIPNPKSQIPKTKSQGSSKRPNSKFQRGAAHVTLFGRWRLRFVWDLGFGIWNFRGS
jgi:hypothetical protein